MQRKYNLIALFIVLVTSGFNVRAEVPEDSSKFIPIEKFMYADHRRYTITGETPLKETKLKPVTTAIIGTVLTGMFIYQHELQQNTIWKRVGPFNVREDARWTAGLDKCGHFYGTYLPAYILTETLLSSGFSWDASFIIGASLGLGYTTYIEILDGFSRDFGFSPSDFYADVVGASFFLGQHYFPVLQNFTPKFLYINPRTLGELPRYKADTFIDNYSAQTFWLSMNVHNLLPEDYKKFWPDWLELSVGYAVYSLAAGYNTTDPTKDGYVPPEYSTREKIYSDTWGKRRILISLEPNLVKLIPDSWNTINWIRQGLNHLKLPTPTLEIGRTTKFYLLYPWHF